MLVPSSGKDHPPGQSEVSRLSVGVDSSVHGREGSPEAEDELGSEVIVVSQDCSDSEREIEEEESQRGS